MSTRNVWPPLTTRPMQGSSGSGLLRLVGIQQPGRVQVAFVVIDRHQRQIVDPGQRARHRDAHQQGAGEARDPP